MLETATTYILNLLTDNEELKKFPKEFINESVLWVKSWFLTPEDPKASAKLEDPNKSVEVKKDIIQDKLEDLKDNPQFVKELESRLAAFEHQRSRLKNVISDSDIDVAGNFHTGDKGATSDGDYDEKNIIKGSTIKAGGDFRLGDDIVQAGGNVHVGDIHYHGSAISGKNAPPSLGQSPVTKKLRALIASGRTSEAIPQLLDHAEVHAAHLLDDASQLSARWEILQRKERNGILSNAEANVERNQVSAALLELIGQLKG